MKNYFKEGSGIALITLMTIPMTAFAQALTKPTALVVAIKGIIDLLIPLLLSLAVVAFFWGLVKYIANASDEAAKESGKTLMIWGMVAIFVMVALWGILGYISTTLEISGTINTGTAPTFNPPAR